jgi:hypothetical protein
MTAALIVLALCVAFTAAQFASQPVTWTTRQTTNFSPLTFNDHNITVVVGSAVSSYNAIPYVTAYNTVTGAVQWNKTFDFYLGVTAIISVTDSTFAAIDFQAIWSINIGNGTVEWMYTPKNDYPNTFSPDKIRLLSEQVPLRLWVSEWNGNGKYNRRMSILSAATGHVEWVSKPAAGILIKQYELTCLDDGRCAFLTINNTNMSAVRSPGVVVAINPWATPVKVSWSTTEIAGLSSIFGGFGSAFYASSYVAASDNSGNGTVHKIDATTGNVSQFVGPFVGPIGAVYSSATGFIVVATAPQGWNTTPKFMMFASSGTLASTIEWSGMSQGSTGFAAPLIVRESTEDAHLVFLSVQGTFVIIKIDAASKTMTGVASTVGQNGAGVYVPRLSAFIAYGFLSNRQVMVFSVHTAAVITALGGLGYQNPHGYGTFAVPTISKDGIIVATVGSVVPAGSGSGTVIACDVSRVQTATVVTPGTSFFGHAFSRDSLFLTNGYASQFSMGNAKLTRVNAKTLTISQSISMQVPVNNQGRQLVFPTSRPIACNSGIYVVVNQININNTPLYCVVRMAHNFTADEGCLMTSCMPQTIHEMKVNCGTKKNVSGALTSADVIAVTTSNDAKTSNVTVIAPSGDIKWTRYAPSKFNGGALSPLIIGAHDVTTMSAQAGATTGAVIAFDLATGDLKYRSARPVAANVTVTDTQLWTMSPSPSTISVSDLTGGAAGNTSTRDAVDCNSTHGFFVDATGSVFCTATNGVMRIGEASSTAVYTFDSSVKAAWLGGIINTQNGTCGIVASQLADGTADIALVRLDTGVVAWHHTFGSWQSSATNFIGSPTLLPGTDSRRFGVPVDSTYNVFDVADGTLVQQLPSLAYRGDVSALTTCKRTCHHPTDTTCSADESCAWNVVNRECRNSCRQYTADNNREGCNANSACFWRAAGHSCENQCQSALLLMFDTSVVGRYAFD